MITYSECLKLFSENLKITYVTSSVLSSTHISYMNYSVILRFDYVTSIFYCIYVREDSNEDIIKFQKFKIFERTNHNYFIHVSPINGELNVLNMIDTKLIDIPQTKDEWFNFSVLNDLTYDDFLNFKRICEHYDTIC